ncbi:IclR family transcriptional regulator [Rubritalea tangerina]|uniref:IclR family transcriptional regulator n=1 Tax=Rubritalea tangerina TaxID=430798 RepID=A0ABW4ZEM3_9BACT
MDMEAKYVVPSLERAMRVLELLSQHRDGMIVSQIAKELGVPRNSIFRICVTLRDAGYIAFFQGTQSYVLTRKLFTIGYRAMGDVNLVQLAREPMLALRDTVRETVLLGTLLDCEGAVLEEVAGTHHFNFRVEKGAKFHLHCSAPGKVLLAHLSKAEQAKVVDRIELVAFNENTITSKNDLLDGLERIKLAGVAYDRAEQIEGCHCIAAPVKDPYGYPVAALWVTGPSSRLPESKFVDVGSLVKSAADQVTKLLGGAQ